MAGVISSVSCMGMLAILLMIIRLEAVDAVLAWDCGVDKLEDKKTVKFSDINDKELVKSLKKLGNEYPDEFAYKFKGEEGYIADMQRDMFYIFQCKPVAAILEPQDKCYDRLPIMIKDKKLFLSPRTHIIATKANEISCNAPYLQDYELEFYTYKVVPRPEGRLDPKEVDSETRDRKNPSPIKVLKPTTNSTWKYKEMDNLGTSGIYTEEEVNSAWDKILHPNSYRRGEGVIDRDTTNHVHITLPNAPKIPWYKKDLSYLVYIGVAALLIVIVITTLSISLLMLVGHMKHDAALHFFRRGNRHRQMRSNQADLTIRLNKETE